MADQSSVLALVILAVGVTVHFSLHKVEEGHVGVYYRVSKGRWFKTFNLLKPVEFGALPGCYIYYYIFFLLKLIIVVQIVKGSLFKFCDTILSLCTICTLNFSFKSQILIWKVWINYKRYSATKLMITFIKVSALFTVLGHFLYSNHWCIQNMSFKRIQTTDKI